MIKIIQDKAEPNLELIINNSEPFQENKIYKYLKGKTKLKILDLGSRVPIILMICYHELDTYLLQGVDIAKDQKECLINLANNEFMLENGVVEMAEYLYEDCTCFYDFYEDKIHPDANSLIYKKLSLKEFNQKIIDNYRFNTKIEDFINDCNIKYDLIICNNVLHFTNQNECLISKIFKLLKTDGIIYIKVENQTRTNYNEEKFIIELNNSFTEGSIHQSFINGNWHGMVFINHEV